MSRPVWSSAHLLAVVGAGADSEMAGMTGEPAGDDGAGRLVGHIGIAVPAGFGAAFEHLTDQRHTDRFGV